MDFYEKKEAPPEGNQKPEEEKYREMSTSGGLLESAVDDFAKKGGFDDLVGKGKPLKIDEGDVLTSIMKNANYQPPWIELRKEIVTDIKKLMDQSHVKTAEGMEHQMDVINQKIRKFNRLVPSPLLQKGLVSSANLQIAYEKWL